MIAHRHQEAHRSSSPSRYTKASNARSRSLSYTRYEPYPGVLRVKRERDEGEEMVEILDDFQVKREPEEESVKNPAGAAGVAGRMPRSKPAHRRAVSSSHFYGFMIPSCLHSEDTITGSRPAGAKPSGQSSTPTRPSHVRALSTPVLLPSVRRVHSTPSPHAHRAVPYPSPPSSVAEGPSPRPASPPTSIAPTTKGPRSSRHLIFVKPLVARHLQCGGMVHIRSVDGHRSFNVCLPAMASLQIGPLTKA
ncbi:hypothetical protein IAU60_002052 [Kwoniella sp. DSM 27419]